jgi:hypothetical protein
MKGLWLSVLTIVAVGVATPVAAQTPAGSSPPAAAEKPWSVGVNSGVAVVEKATGVFGVEVGRRVWRRMEIVAEGVWIQNGENKSQKNAMGLLASYLEQAQGTTATASMKVPLLYGGIGVRWIVTQASRFKPYALFTAGGVHSKLEPSLKVGGTDITSSAEQYGITLGSDVTGTANSSAVSVGLGVLMTSGQWSIDVGARMLNMGGATKRFNAGRLVLGGGYRF